MTNCTGCEAAATHHVGGHDWCSAHARGYMHHALAVGMTPAGYVLAGSPTVGFPEGNPAPAKPKPLRWAPPVVLPPGTSTRSGRPQFRSRSWVHAGYGNTIPWRTSAKPSAA